MKHCDLRIIAVALTFVPIVAFGQAGQKELLAGSWLHSIKILGQSHDSIITFWSDGTFREDALLGDMASHIKDPAKPLHLPIDGGKRGQWTLSGKLLTQKYHPPGEITQQQSTETRLVKVLTDQHFVSADQQFNIEIDRRRVIQPVYFEANRKQRWSAQ